MAKVDKKAAALPVTTPKAMFLFLPENSKTRGIGWHSAITGVVGIAVAPREVQMELQAVVGGRVLCDAVDIDAVLAEAKTNNMNTPIAKSRQDMKQLWFQAQLDHGARVSAHNAGEKTPAAEPEAAPVAE